MSGVNICVVVFLFFCQINCPTRSTVFASSTNTDRFGGIDTGKIERFVAVVYDNYCIASISSRVLRREETGVVRCAADSTPRLDTFKRK